MKTTETTMTRLAAAVALACILTGTGHAIAQTPPPAAVPQPGPNAPSLAEHVGAMKKSLAESKASLRSYEWIETTVVWLKEEEKASIQKRCYYGADGKVQKIEIEPLPEPDKKRGIRGRIIEKKKAELSEYMKQAVALVHQYVPPDTEKVQKVKDAGNVSITILDPGQRVGLVLKEYLMPGDQLNVEMTLADSRLGAITVATFLDNEDTKKSERDPVNLEVHMGSLDDGTTYAEEITLKAEAKQLKIVVTNSGYRKIEK